MPDTVESTAAVLEETPETPKEGDKEPSNEECENVIESNDHSDASSDGNHPQDNYKIPPPPGSREEYEEIARSIGFSGALTPHSPGRERTLLSSVIWREE